MNTKIFLLLFFSVFIKIGNGQLPIDSIALNIEIEADSIKANHKDYNGAIAKLNLFFSQPDFEKASSVSRSAINHKIAVNQISLGNYLEAVHYAGEAIKIRNESDFLEKSELANSHFIRGYSNAVLKLFQNAIKDFQAAIDILQPIANTRNIKKDKRRLFQYFSHLGKSYRELNDFGQGLKYYQAADDYLEKAYGRDSRTAAGFFSSLALFYQETGDQNTAIEYINKELAIYRDLKNPRLLSRILVTELNLANSYLNKNELNLAKIKYQKLIEEADRENDKMTSEIFYDIKSSCFRNIGLADLRLGNPTEAKRNYEKAMQLLKQEKSLNNPTSISEIYEGLADVDAAEKKFGSALDNYQKAIALLCLDFNPANNLALPNLSSAVIHDKITLKRILALKGKALLEAYADTKDQKYLSSAYDTYNGLDTLIALVRQSYQSDLSRYDLIEGTVAIYEKATEAALDLYELKKEPSYLEAAFNFSSKNKAIVLLEGKQNESAKFAGIPADLLEQEGALKEKLYDLEQAIFEVKRDEGENKAKLDSLGQLRFSQSRDYEKLIANFEENYPDYHQLKYATDYMDVAELMSHIPAEAALVEYFVGNENLLIFTLSKSGLAYHRESKPEDFEKYCHTFRGYSDGSTTASLETFAKSAEDLYSLLLAKPLAALEEEKINRLFIIPDDYLHEISFDALFYTPVSKEKLNTGWGVKDLPYLIKKYAISYAYSNQLLFDTAVKGKQKGKKLFAGFGLDYRETSWDNVVASGTRALGTNWRGKIRPLPYAVEEVDEIGAVLDGDVWLNQEATKANFVEKAGDYQILHLAMHGVVEKDFPLSSALIFDKQIDSSDYFLTAGDLYSQKLTADMVVLSACDTGSGQLQKGEGAMTLARAFKYAGCPSLVASLWAASDESTKDLMVDFYAHLKEGLPKDLALRQAKLQYLESDLSPNASKPFNWSHIAIIGDATALNLNSFSAYYWLFGLALVALLFFFLRRR